MSVLDGIEICFGVLACVGVLVSAFATLDTFRVRRYQRANNINGLQARYGRERIREEVLSVIIETAMGLAAAAALVQRAEPGYQRQWTAALILALCIAQVLLVTKIVMRRITRRRMLAAIARNEAAAKDGTS